MEHDGSFKFLFFKNRFSTTLHNFFCELSLSSGATQHIPVKVLKNMMPDPEHEHLGSDDREYEWMKMCCILHLILVLSSMKLDKSKLWSFR